MPDQVTHSVFMLEPDPDDQFLTNFVAKDLAHLASFVFFETAEELRARLHQNNSSGSSLPSLVLISLDADPSSQLQLLKTLKLDLHFDHIPVVILMEAEHRDLAKKCYEMGAASVILKPSGEEKTRKSISGFMHYWFETVTFG